MFATVTIPERIFGPFVIRVQTDSGNQVYEHTNENDNYASSMVRQHSTISIAIMKIGRGLYLPR
jgi:hypothetical protein